MAKPPPIEKFHVLLAIEKDRLGEDMAMLSRHGIQVISCELVTTIAAYKANKIGIAEPGSNNEEFLAEWIKDNPTFKANAAAEHFEASGRARTSVYAALTTLTEKGILKKLDKLGHYARADVKHIEGPKKKHETKKPEEHKSFDKPGTDVIISYARRNHGRFNTPKLIELFEKEGRKANSVYGSINKLLEDKMVKRVGDKGSGQYVLLSKAQTDRKKQIIAEKKPAPQNGAASHEEPQVEMTHG